MSSTPQFGTADYNSAAGGSTCQSCKQTISGSYYRVNGVLACDRCTEQVRQQLPKDSHAAFVRGIVFGVGGAIAGLILYSAFGIITGLEIGYVALAVGWLVGKAIKKGSTGVGGRRYQVAALALTYAAVSMSAIPMGIAQYMKQKKEHPPAVASTAPPPASSSENAQSGDASDEKTAAGPDVSSTKPHVSFAGALGSLALLGLASPFLELQSGFSGMIGLVILFVGIRIAWQITAASQVDIVGPFQAAANPPATMG